MPTTSATRGLTKSLIGIINGQSRKEDVTVGSVGRFDSISQNSRVTRPILEAPTMTADKTQITLSLAPDVLEKVESIASKSGLTGVQLLESIAKQLADGELNAALAVTSRFGLQDLQFKMDLEALIKNHEASNEELRAELKKSERRCYLNG